MYCSTCFSINNKSKKKELIGNFSREGHAYTQSPADALNYDFPSTGGSGKIARRLSENSDRSEGEAG